MYDFLVMFPGDQAPIWEAYGFSLCLFPCGVIQTFSIVPESQDSLWLGSLILLLYLPDQYYYVLSTSTSLTTSFNIF